MDLENSTTFFTCCCILLGTLLLKDRWRLQGRGHSSLRRPVKLFGLMILSTALVWGLDERTPTQVRGGEVRGHGQRVVSRGDLILRTKFFDERARRTLRDTISLFNQERHLVRIAGENKSLTIREIVDAAERLRQEVESFGLKATVVYPRGDPFVREISGGDISKLQAAMRVLKKHHLSELTLNTRDFEQYLGVLAKHYKYASKLMDRVLIMTRTGGTEEKHATLENLQTFYEVEVLGLTSIQWYHEMSHRWAYLRLKDAKVAAWQMYFDMKNSWRPPNVELDKFVSDHESLARKWKTRSLYSREFEQMTKDANEGTLAKHCPFTRDFEPMSTDGDGLFLMCQSMRDQEVTRPVFLLSYLYFPSYCYGGFTQELWPCISKEKLANRTFPNETLWLIHGLWSALSEVDETRPESEDLALTEEEQMGIYNSSVDFAALRAKLNIAMPGVVGNVVLPVYQYRKHGRHMQIFNETRDFKGYLESIIELHDKVVGEVPRFGHLRKLHALPGRTWKSSHELKELLNLSTIFNVRKDFDSNPPTYLLSEVHFCFSRSQKLVDCPEARLEWYYLPTISESDEKSIFGHKDVPQGAKLPSRGTNLPSRGTNQPRMGANQPPRGANHRQQGANGGVGAHIPTPIDHNARRGARGRAARDGGARGHAAPDGGAHGRAARDGGARGRSQR